MYKYRSLALSASTAVFIAFNACPARAETAWCDGLGDRKGLPILVVNPPQAIPDTQEDRLKELTELYWQSKYPSALGITVKCYDIANRPLDHSRNLAIAKEGHWEIITDVVTLNTPSGADLAIKPASISKSLDTLLENAAHGDLPSDIPEQISLSPADLSFLKSMKLLALKGVTPAHEFGAYLALNVTTVSSTSMSIRLTHPIDGDSNSITLGLSPGSPAPEGIDGLIAAEFHTHPTANLFSPNDLYLSAKLHIPSFVADAEGTVWLAVPTTLSPQYNDNKIVTEINLDRHIFSNFICNYFTPDIERKIALGDRDSHVIATMDGEFRTAEKLDIGIYRLIDTPQPHFEEQNKWLLSAPFGYPPHELLPNEYNIATLRLFDALLHNRAPTAESINEPSSLADFFAKVKENGDALKIFRGVLNAVLLLNRQADDHNPLLQVNESFGSNKYAFSIMREWDTNGCTDHAVVNLITSQGDIPILRSQVDGKFVKIP